MGGAVLDEGDWASGSISLEATLRRRRCGRESLDLSEPDRCTSGAGNGWGGCSDEGEARVDLASLFDEARDCCETVRWCRLLPDENRRSRSMADGGDVAFATEFVGCDAEDVVETDPAGPTTSDGPELRRTGCIRDEGGAASGDDSDCVLSNLNALTEAT